MTNTARSGWLNKRYTMQSGLCEKWQILAEGISGTKDWEEITSTTTDLGRND